MGIYDKPGEANRKARLKGLMKGFQSNPIQKQPRNLGAGSGKQLKKSKIKGKK